MMVNNIDEHEHVDVVEANLIVLMIEDVADIDKIVVVVDVLNTVEVEMDIHVKKVLEKDIQVVVVEHNDLIQEYLQQQIDDM